MPRTSFGKTRPQETPYATYASRDGWVWKVLKTYKHSEAEKTDPHARWFVAATSPLMHNGSYELGDTYRSDVVAYGKLIDADLDWYAEYGGEKARA
tara:strand:+ start:157 stop:444 length:288 start_codon:yes stop_codon:yes gene_type:complete